MIRFARLLKDLPDVKAGAIFYVLSKDHWDKTTDEPYSSIEYHFFPKDSSVKREKGLWSKDDYCRYYVDQMTPEWFEFYDFADGKWKPLEKVKLIELE